MEAIMFPPSDNVERPLKAFTAGFGTETNSFSPVVTDMAAFERTFLYRPGEHPEALTEVSAPLFVLRSCQRQQRWKRSEERRVGKEGVGKCRYRWSPHHEKKNYEYTNK